jgi:hypothetical protein
MLRLENEERNRCCRSDTCFAAFVTCSIFSNTIERLRIVGQAIGGILLLGRGHKHRAALIPVPSNLRETVPPTLCLGLLLKPQVMGH